MMAKGERRYLFQLVFETDTWDFLRSAGHIVDVTANPRRRRARDLTW